MGFNHGLLMNNEKSYLKAQRQYDNQLPPDDDSVDCEDCEGDGKLELSNCCGAVMDIDTLMCSECYDHCDQCECETCDGTGQVSGTAMKYKAKEEYLERKAEVTLAELDIGERFVE